MSLNDLQDALGRIKETLILELKTTGKNEAYFLFRGVIVFVRAISNGNSHPVVNDGSKFQLVLVNHRPERITVESESWAENQRLQFRRYNDGKWVLSEEIRPAEGGPLEPTSEQILEKQEVLEVMSTQSSEQIQTELGWESETSDRILNDTEQEYIVVDLF